MESITYTGDYQIDDDYNPYKYVNEAPFGAEDSQPEPLNMQGALGMLMFVIGIMLWQA
jgi:hypothetical protein